MNHSVLTVQSSLLLQKQNGMVTQNKGSFSISLLSPSTCKHQMSASWGSVGNVLVEQA